MEANTERFFNLYHEHTMSDWRFFRSGEGKQWFRELRHLASEMQGNNRKYAEWLVEETSKAVKEKDAKWFMALAMNAFDTQMKLIWA